MKVRLWIDQMGGIPVEVRYCVRVSPPPLTVVIFLDIIHFWLTYSRSSFDDDDTDLFLDRPIIRVPTHTMVKTLKKYLLLKLPGFRSADEVWYVYDMLRKHTVPDLLRTQTWCCLVAFCLAFNMSAHTNGHWFWWESPWLDIVLIRYRIFPSLKLWDGLRELAL